MLGRDFRVSSTGDHVHALRWLYYGDCYFEVFQSEHDNELRLALHFNPSFVTITLYELTDATT